jgi:hypothetical protein
MPDVSDGPELVADCTRCFGLCCVLLPFSAAAGFGIDKPGGTPCHHLQHDDRCGIHATLRADGWPGCTAFDCFGAGQQVSQVTYAGRSWRDRGDGTPPDRGEMAAVLSVMRMLHEMLTHPGEAARRTGTRTGRTADLRAEVRGLVDGTPEELLTLDLDELRDRVGAELRAVSAAQRGAGPQPGRDLAGRDLRDRDLRRADLRGAVLIRADLRGADLTLADLLGADLRDADLRGADLAEALFLTRAQVNTARGDAATRLPAGLPAPGHWPQVRT